MRRSREDAAETRRAIVEAASRLIRAKGIASVSVADVMGAVGLTVGGFYRHFRDKEALVAEAIEAASRETIDGMEKVLDRSGDSARLAAFVERYLSPAHLSRPDRGCPVPALAAEVSHEGEGTRAALQRAIHRAVAMLEPEASADGGSHRRDALYALSAAVGAVVLARALRGTALADELVDAVRSALLERTRRRV